MRKPKLDEVERKKFEWYATCVNKCTECGAQKIWDYLLWCEREIRKLRKEVRSLKK